MRDRVNNTQVRTMYDLKLSESRFLADELKAEVEAYNRLQAEKLELSAAITVHRAAQVSSHAHTRSSCTQGVSVCYD